MNTDETSRKYIVFTSIGYALASIAFPILAFPFVMIVWLSVYLFWLPLSPMIHSLNLDWLAKAVSPFTSVILATPLLLLAINRSARPVALWLSIAVLILGVVAGLAFIRGVHGTQ